MRYVKWGSVGSTVAILITLISQGARADGPPCTQAQLNMKADFLLRTKTDSMDKDFDFFLLNNPDGSLYGMKITENGIKPVCWLFDEIRNGVTVLHIAGRDITKLEGPALSRSSGGEILFTLLKDYISGDYRTLPIELERADNGEWELAWEGQPFDYMYFESARIRVLNKAKGIKSIRIESGGHELGEIDTDSLMSR